MSTALITIHSALLPMFPIRIQTDLPDGLTPGECDEILILGEQNGPRSQRIAPDRFVACGSEPKAPVHMLRRVTQLREMRRQPGRKLSVENEPHRPGGLDDAVIRQMRHIE